MVNRAPSLALALGLGLASCGLLPAPGPDAPVPGDGVAGFGEAAPIELCLGTAHVVAPDASSGAGAVCVAEGATVHACSADSACEGIERCVCGRCIVEACQGGASCSNGGVCRDNRCTVGCALDTDCQSGEVCDVGGCARSCGSDGDCHHGERCEAFDGVCVAKLCDAATPCGPGATCEAESVTGELHEPELATLAGETVAYVELRTVGAGASSAIYRARVDQPARWTADPGDPVIAGAGAPSVLVDGSRVELYFAASDGASIARAVSTDGGVTFTRDAAPVLVPAVAWEQGWVGSPAVVRWNGATLLFYEGGPRAGIGMARVSASGATATRTGDAPIVTPATIEDPLFWREVTEVGAPYALVDGGGALRVYFTGRGAEGSDAIVDGVDVPADVNDSIGLVASLDGVTFVPSPTGPVLARVTNLRAYLGEREAAVRLLEGGGAEITFVAFDASGTSESGLARATQ